MNKEIMIDSMIDATGNIGKDIVKNQPKIQKGRYIVKSTEHVTLVHNDKKKLEKDMEKQITKKLNEFGLKKYYNFETKGFNGNPSNDKKNKILSLIKYVIENKVEQRQNLMQKVKTK
jgi:hypothetical protein